MNLSPVGRDCRASCPLTARSGPSAVGQAEGFVCEEYYDHDPYTLARVVWR